MTIVEPHPCEGCEHRSEVMAAEPARLLNAINKGSAILRITVSDLKEHVVMDGYSHAGCVQDLLKFHHLTIGS